MMTALNNYVGQHMSQSELRALASAGFVNSNDLITNKIGDVKGLKPCAKLLEADTFKSNIAQWAWDFHDTFMQRKGANEGGFDDLIARMPRNMAGLIAFLTHNEARLKRDAGTLDTPVGLAAANDSSLANNPGAGLAALRDSITQFAATVTSPAVAAAAPAIAGLAHAIQTMSAAAGDFAKAHPQLATAGSAGAVAGAGATGGWLSWKLFTGIGKLLGFGDGAAAAGGGAAAAGSGLGRIIAGAAGAASLPGLIDLVTGDNRTAAARANDAAVMARLKSWAFGPSLGPPAPMMGRDVHGPSTGPYAYFPAHAAGPQSVSVSGAATIEHTVRVDVHVDLDPDLRAKIDQAVHGNGEFTVPLIGGGLGRMDSDAGPTHHGGIGRM
jgi:hypothetical protein